MRHDVMVMMALAIVTCTAAPVRAANDGSACRSTSHAALTACRFEAADDYWIASGRCVNLSNAAARQACNSEARDSYDEARHECQDQFAAREDLCRDLGQAPYDPVVNPANFLSPDDTAANPNPFFPLVPGAVRIYEGPGEIITVTVTSRTKVILGVTTMVIRDTVVDEDGVLVEDTEDWYAQDVAGNVWYFGEIAQNFEDGDLVNVDGSWKAGIDRAKIGIVMEADPAVGDVYRQEFDLGNAEDAAEVVSTTGSESVPAASCDGTCVVTRDFTPISPEAVEFKHYAPGIGLILEVDPETGDRVELVSSSG